MKHILLSALLLMSLAGNAQQAVQPVDGTDCSNLFFKALLERNDAALRSLMSGDFTVISFDGRVVDGSQLQQAISGGEIVVSSGMLSGTSTKSYGDVAIVTGQWDLAARIGDNNFRGQLAYIAVCVRAGGTWKVTTVQLTPLRG